jgi:hypothetical protein
LAWTVNFDWGRNGRHGKEIDGRCWRWVERIGWTNDTPPLVVVHHHRPVEIPTVECPKLAWAATKRVAPPSWRATPRARLRLRLNHPEREPIHHERSRERAAMQGSRVNGGNGENGGWRMAWCVNLKVIQGNGEGGVGLGGGWGWIGTGETNDGVMYWSLVLSLLNLPKTLSNSNFRGLRLGGKRPPSETS